MKQITDTIYQLSLGSVNTFVIEDNGLTLIDTGLPGGKDKIFSSLEKAGKNPADIKQIILTHCHTDHAGSAEELVTELNVPVFAHTIDAELIEQGISSRPMTLTPGFINWMVYQLFIKKAAKIISPVKVIGLNDNDILPIAGGIQVIHTPGHSAGHIALLIKEQGVLIAADICANFGSLAYSTLYEDILLGQKSILKAAAFSFDKALFGHGGPLLKDANKKLQEKFAL